MNERIALLIESDGPGGAESVVLALAHEYRSAGNEVFPVVHQNGPGWLSSRLSSSGFSVLRPSLNGPVDPSAAIELARWMRRERITAVHSHEFTTSVYACAPARILGLPSIMTMHGGLGYTYAMRRRLALSLAARMSTAVVGVSDATADTLAESLWLDRRRVHVVSNGIIARSGDRANGRALLSLSPDDYLVLAVGNLYTVKGHDVLIKAAAMLKQDWSLPSWRVAIAGRGGEEATLRKLIEALGLEDKVFLLGLRDDIPDLLAAADVFAMPSLSEGLPMALLEAMFSSTPVVASRVGGIPDLLEHGALGLLCSAGDTDSLAQVLRESLSERASATERAERAFHRASERYSAASMAQAYLDILSNA